MKKTLYFLLLALLPWMSFAPVGKPVPAAATDRALFFACNQYANLKPLNNPVPNAREIAALLKQNYGFQTEILTNPGLEQMENKLREYQQKYQNGTFDRKGQLLVFFSGHGAVENEIGFFLPVDADPKRLKYTALDYPYWRNFLDNLPVQHLFVSIGACYSVRFDARWNTRPDGRFQRVGELSDREKLLQDHANTKTRIFFTSDGKGEETPDKSNFAKKFQEGLLSGGGADGILTSTELYAYVEGARPRPHCSEFGDDRAESSFLFITTSANLSGLEADAAAWDRAAQSGAADAYRAYLRDFPGGSFAALARQRIAASEAEAARLSDLNAWNQARGSDTPAAYRAYLAAQPQGRFREAATAAIEERERVTIPISSTPKPVDLPDRPTMIPIPGGSFDMGSNEGDSDEKPVHRVQVAAFELAETEITNAQYCAFLNARRAAAAELEKWINLAGSYSSEKCRIQQKGSAYTVEAGYEAHPVIYVSWYGAIAYCEWLSQQTGQRYRLPSEAEWEYAAGGGTSGRTKWAGTNAESELRSFGNFSGTGGQDSYAGTAPVRSFRPNALGLYDMSGNVWEWCQDTWHSDYQGAPANGSAWEGGSSADRVDRGGSWYNSASYLRVAYRSFDDPGYRDSHLGFRPARTP